MKTHYQTVSRIDVDPNKKSFPAYVLGLFLSLILTFAAFGLVQYRWLDHAALYVALAGLAITQFVVQAVCFLRLNTSKDGTWNLLPFLFMLFIVAVLVGGSLWIMYHLNMNMS